MGKPPISMADPDPPQRFATIADVASEARPLIFDPAAVLALEPRADGRYAMHLVAGQTIVLQAEAASAVFAALGLGSGAKTAPKTFRPIAAARRARRPKQADAGDRQPGEPRVKLKGGRKPAPKSLWASAASIFASVVNG